jgi:hypothetical protein
VFVKEFEKFKKDVRKTIFGFFKMEPEELEERIDDCHRQYDRFYDLDKVSFKDVRPDLKDSVMLYRTMSYFYRIWVDLNKLESSITSIGGLDD